MFDDRNASLPICTRQQACRRAHQAKLIRIFRWVEQRWEKLVARDVLGKVQRPGVQRAGIWKIRQRWKRQRVARKVACNLLSGKTNVMSWHESKSSNKERKREYAPCSTDGLYRYSLQDDYGISNIRKRADKGARNPRENSEWNEKWWENTTFRGDFEKGVEKMGMQDRRSWGEKWGEAHTAPGKIRRWSDKWAQVELAEVAHFSFSCFRKAYVQAHTASIRLDSSELNWKAICVPLFSFFFFFFRVDRGKMTTSGEINGKKFSKKTRQVQKWVSSHCHIGSKYNI